MKIHSKLIILSLLTLSIACKEKAKDSLMTENSLLKEWEGPYEGVPNF